jgi:hypothetical protein
LPPDLRLIKRSKNLWRNAQDSEVMLDLSPPPSRSSNPRLIRRLPQKPSRREKRNKLKSPNPSRRRSLRRRKLKRLRLFSRRNPLRPSKSLLLRSKSLLRRSSSSKNFKRELSSRSSNLSFKRDLLLLS